MIENVSSCCFMPFKVLQWFIFFVVYQCNYTSQDKKRIMSHKNSKKAKSHTTFMSQIVSVLHDIITVYKNFIHWNISKILISLWSFTLWVIISLPVFITVIIVWFIDPIEWSQIIIYILSGSDISYQIIGDIAMHPYNLVFMVFLIMVSTCLFLLWSSYSLFLKAKLSLGYIKWKKLAYAKNSYFHRWYIVRYIGIMSWNFTYILAPIIIWAGLIFFMYLFYNIGFIWIHGLSIWVAIYTIILIVCELYLIYRLIFGYILLSDDSHKKELHGSLYYVKKSIEITKWKSFFKFLIFYIVFVLLISPTTILDNHLEQQWSLMRDTMVYNSWLLQNLDSEQIQYYEYISREYNDLSSEELASKLNSITTLRFVLYFTSYLIISGIFVLLLSSFYRRILLWK